MAQLATPLMVASTVLSAQGSLNAGKAAKKQAEAVAMGKEAEAAQLVQKAGQERALSQRRADIERKRERLVQSSLQARAAASGAGAADPGVVDLAEDIAAEGDFRTRMALHQGEETGRGLEYGGELRRYEAEDALRAGRIAKSAYNMQAVTTLLSGGANYGLYQKYGRRST